MSETAAQPVVSAPEPSKEERVQGQIERLLNHMGSKLLAKERPTFDIRPAVTHYDIEVFLNGWVYPVRAAHLQKVEEAGLLRRFAGEIVDRLRSRRYALTAENFKYTLENVFKEQIETLWGILERVLPEEEIAAIETRMGKELAAHHQVELYVPDSYTQADFYLCLRMLAQEVSDRIKARRPKPSK